MTDERVEWCQCVKRKVSAFLREIACCMMIYGVLLCWKWPLVLREVAFYIAGGGFLHYGRWLPECREVAFCMSKYGFLMLFCSVF